MLHPQFRSCIWSLKMRAAAVICALFLVSVSVYGKPFPSSPAIKESTSTTPKPWLRFLKDKKATSTVPTTEPSVKVDNSVILPPSPILSSPSHPASVIRAVGPAPGSNAVPTQSAVYDYWNSLMGYLDPTFYSTSQLAPSAPNILAQDRKLNPDTMYDEMYLDWMKREAEPFAPATPSPNAEEMQGPTAAAGYPAYPAAYGYPAAMPFPFYPALAGFKMQKVMAQAQMDAALAAMNITTTPKPIKLKLKITMPGGADLSQLSALTNSLPPGSTFSLD